MKWPALLLLCSLTATAQNTLNFQAESKTPKATLHDVAWIAGHWKGEALGGVTEEIWSPPLGGSMMFVFKLVVDGKVSFYEVGHIQEMGETLILQLKHFTGHLAGWEEKDKTVDFKLVKVEANRVYFDGFTFERSGPDELIIFITDKGEDGTRGEIKFNYIRA